MLEKVYIYHLGSQHSMLDACKRGGNITTKGKQNNKICPYMIYKRNVKYYIVMRVIKALVKVWIIDAFDTRRKKMNYGCIWYTLNRTVSDKRLSHMIIFLSINCLMDNQQYK